MRLEFGPLERHRLLVLLAALAGLVLAVEAAGAGVKKPSGGSAVITYDTTAITPIVRDTPTNLQAAFGNEINAQQRYVAYMKQAEVEGYPAVARLFRACADAESVHAHRFVEAIAVTGAQARAVLEKLLVPSTEQNLETAISAERWEVQTWYPALLVRARSEHWPMATRALTGALAAEREHVTLLESALATLDRHPAPVAYYVCGGCGRTVLHPDRGKCPQCFGPSSRYIRV